MFARKCIDFKIKNLQTLGPLGHLRFAMGDCDSLSRHEEAPMVHEQSSNTLGPPHRGDCDSLSRHEEAPMVHEQSSNTLGPPHPDGK